MSTTQSQSISSIPASKDVGSQHLKVAREYVEYNDVELPRDNFRERSSRNIGERILKQAVPSMDRQYTNPDAYRVAISCKAQELLTKDGFSPNQRNGTPDKYLQKAINTLPKGKSASFYRDVSISAIEKAEKEFPHQGSWSNTINTDVATLERFNIVPGESPRQGREYNYNYGNQDNRYQDNRYHHQDNRYNSGEILPGLKPGAILNGVINRAIRGW